MSKFKLVTLRKSSEDEEEKLKKKKRKLIKPKISFLSLCPRGANQLPVSVTKEDSDSGSCDFSLETLTKSLDQEGSEIAAVVHVPNMVDAQGDYFDQEGINQAIETFAKEGLKLDLRHNEKALTKDQAFVKENFTIQKNDSRFSGLTNYKGEAVDATGGWAVVIKIEDEGLREKYRKGEWNGVSMGGTAIAVTKEEETPDENLLARLTKIYGLLKDFSPFKKADKNETTKPNKNEVEMTKEEIIALFKEMMKESLEAQKQADVKKAEDESEKAEKIKKEDAEKIKKMSAEQYFAEMDPSNPAHLEVYGKKLRKEAIIAEAKEKLNMADPEDVAKLQKQLMEIEAPAASGWKFSPSNQKPSDRKELKKNVPGDSDEDEEIDEAFEKELLDGFGCDPKDSK